MSTYGARTIRALRAAWGRDAALQKLPERFVTAQQQRISGGGLSPNSDATKFDVAIGKYVIDGLEITTGAVTAKVLTGLTPNVNTTGSQCRKVLVTIKRSDASVGVYSGVAAATQGAAVLPEVPDGEIATGYIEIPVSFTAGSTSITEGMCKQADPEMKAFGPLR